MKPPDVKPATRAGAAGDGAKESNSTAKPTGGRPENQGFRPARNAGQRPPRWKAPAGYEAIAELEKLFGPPCRPWKRGRE
jgi:hypothetical protein